MSTFNTSHAVHGRTLLTAEEIPGQTLIWRFNPPMVKTNSAQDLMFAGQPIAPGAELFGDDRGQGAFNNNALPSTFWLEGA